MDKELYWKKLSRAARWRLPNREAEEILADYRELLTDSKGEDLGDPVQAVRLLERPNEYRRWLAVFALLAVLSLAAPVSGLYQVPFEFGLMVFLPVLESLWRFFCRNEVLLAGFPLLGMVLSWAWFRRNSGSPAKRVERRRLLPLLAVQLFCAAAAWWVFWLSASEFSNVAGIFAFLNAHGPWSYRLLRLFLILSGPLCGGLGVWGLVRARTEDRRWLAVYLLGLTAGGVCTGMLAVLSGMNLDTSLPDWWLPYARMYLSLTAAGLLGTGWALC